MRLLIVDDDQEHRQYLADVTANWGYQIEEAGDGEAALALLQERPVDIILSDLMMPKMDGFALLRSLGEQNNLPPTILMTAFGSLEKALQTIHELDGFWFLEKPIDLQALQLLLQRAGRHRQLTFENDELRKQLSFNGVLGDMVGQTAAMQEVFALIRQVAPTTAAVLLTGESGTGKELVARAIHANSKRGTGPFVAINCAAMPETLIESELFGHEKGAFTGAVERRTGALENAHGGTLFLDELGEMPMPMQAKLLRVLEDLRFRRLGGKQEMKADVRIIAATNREPAKAIEAGALREDLYYRLNVFQIQLPPLRERKSDIPLLVDAMIAAMNKKHGAKVAGATQNFLELLQAARWEGNVRELRNVVERAVILCQEGWLDLMHLGPNFRRGPAGDDALPAARGEAASATDSFSSRVWEKEATPAGGAPEAMHREPLPPRVQDLAASRFDAASGEPTLPSKLGFSATSETNRTEDLSRFAADAWGSPLAGSGPWNGHGAPASAEIVLADGASAPPSPGKPVLPIDVGMTIDQAERVLIEATLAHARHNKTKAASILGISTKTLHVKLRQYGQSGEEEQENV